VWRQWQVRGHNVADLDPLGIFAADLDTSEVPELLPHTYALGKARPRPGDPRSCMLCTDLNALAFC